MLLNRITPIAGLAAARVALADLQIAQGNTMFEREHGRNTSSVEGWANELVLLAQHPQLKGSPGFLRPALMTIAQGIQLEQDKCGQLIKLLHSYNPDLPMAPGMKAQFLTLRKAIEDGRRGHCQRTDGRDRTGQDCGGSETGGCDACGRAG